METIRTRLAAARLAVLDTRSKIISYEEACQRVQGRPVRWIAGDFDPLLAQHVRELRNHVTPGRLLIVEVSNPSSPLLAQRARAELVAALAMVDFVVLQDRESPAQPIHDSALTQQFIDHVIARHRGAAPK